MASESSGSRNIGYLKFASGRRHYVYDKTTNACVRIPNAVALVLDDFLAHGADAVRHIYQRRISRRNRSSALEFLDDLVTHHGMFQPSPKMEFTGFLCSDDLEKILISPCRQLTLNITEQCNQRCTYCVYSGDFAGERSHSNQVMTWPIARKSIDYLLSRSQNHTKSRLDFYGGEPLLNWGLVKRCIEYARRSEAGRRLRITVNSNLTVLRDEIARFLVDHDVHISISLDGPQAIHDSSRVFADGGGTHDRVIRQLRKLMDLDPDYCRKHLVIKCTIARTRDISDLFEYFSQDPLKDLDVVLNGLREPVEASPESRSKDRSVRYQQIDQLMKGYLESIRAGKPVNHRLFRGILPTVFSKIALRSLKSDSGEETVGRLCIPGVNGIFVNADGRFFTCENFSHAENCIGSAETGIDTEKARALVATYVGFCEEMCQHCWASRLCSQCFLHTLDQGRISKERMQVNCAVEREKIAKSFERFIYLWDNEPVSFHGNQFSLHSAVNQA